MKPAVVQYLRTTVGIIIIIIIEGLSLCRYRHSLNTDDSPVCRL